MYFKYNNVLAGLLAVGQTLWITQAIPVTCFQPVNNTLVVRGSKVSQVDDLNEYHFKRNVPDPPIPVIMHTNEDNLLKTWSGWYDEPNDSGWDYDAIAHFAILAWEHISEQHKEPWILAALWIRGEGVAFGSQARGLDFPDRTADERLDALLPYQAPTLWHHVHSRTKVGSDTEPKWHAEDVVMWKAAKEMRRLGRPITGTRYPANSMSIYGRYTRRDRKDFMPPCKTRTPQNNNKLTPGCEEVLNNIGIRYYNPKG